LEFIGRTAGILNGKNNVGRPALLHEFEVFVTQSFGSEQDSKTGYRPVYLPLPWSSASRLSLAYPSAELSDLGIARLYDSLVFDWLSPLSEKIPGKIRVSKERLIRKILSELVASRIVFYRERIQSSYPENGANDEHPLRPESPMLKSELDFSSQPTLPGVSLSQDTADFPPSSQPPSQPFAADSSESIPTLQLYTSLSVQPQISRRVALTTSHWETSADPASYDWDAETRRVQEEEELYGEDPQAIQRRKRRAERRRQRQLERMSQQSNVSSSVAPSVMIESSQPPDLPSSSFGRVLPSTQTVEVHIPSSQVFPASFGSREAGKKPLAKDRKKKRAAGF
jgi:RNA polymerase I-specific transcription initiation factor RRN6